jgi:Uma2 family endonuclease
MLTYAEYLAIERETDLRHEFLHGRAWAMSGGTPRHSALKVNLLAFLHRTTEGTPCRPYDSHLKLRVAASGLATYADVAVICGALVPDREDANAATNPVVVIEVLSPSTEAWDRGWKWEHYRSMASLRHYLLVDQGTERVEHYERLPDGSWRYTVHLAGSVVPLTAIGVDLPVASIYAGAPTAP